MIAFHAIITTYGFWLPNDPRGSWSTYVGSSDLHSFAGEATKVTKTHNVADRRHDCRFRVPAKSYLQHPAVSFSGDQARLVAQGFEDVAGSAHYNMLALSVMPTHIHAVIGATDRSPGQVIGHLKRGATDRLLDRLQHPCLVRGRLTHTCWAKKAWKVFIDTESHLAQAIRYVEDNPLKEGKPAQHWPLVTRHRQQWFGGSAPASGAANPIATSR